MYTTTTEATKRYKCPVHHGKNRSVAVGFINGRAWAKCWSRDCASADILAALNLSNSQSIPWTPPPPPPPAPRSTTSTAPLPAVSPVQAAEYMKGVLTPAGATIYYQRNDGRRGKHWRNPDKRRNPGVTGDGWQVRRFNPNDPSAAVAIALTEGEKDAAQLSAAGLIAFTAPRGAQSLPSADFTELVELAKDKGLPADSICSDKDLEATVMAMRNGIRALLKMDFHLEADNLNLRRGTRLLADLPPKTMDRHLAMGVKHLETAISRHRRNRGRYPGAHYQEVGDVQRAERHYSCQWRRRPEYGA